MKLCGSSGFTTSKLAPAERVSRTFGWVQQQQMEGQQRLPRKTPAQQMLFHHMGQLNNVLRASSTQPFGDVGTGADGVPGSPSDVIVGSGPMVNPANQNDAMLNSNKIKELLVAIDPAEKADPVVEELLLQIAEEFITSVATCSCQLARHRGAQSLDVADIQLHLEKNWNIRVPGFSSPETVKPSARRNAVDGHQRRMQIVRRAVAAASAPSLGRKRKASDPCSNVDDFPQQ